MCLRLKDKVAFVSGAASGIGRAEALAFAREGAAVAVADRSLQGAHAVAAEIVSSGGRSLAVSVDVANRLDVERAVAEALTHFGRIDILALTAGRFDDARPSLDTTEEFWDEVFAVNVKGLYFVVNAALPHMISRKAGAIVIVASIAGLLGGGGGAAYTASKHAAVGFGRHLGASYARHGIRTNVIAPGIVDTPMAKDAIASRPVQEMIGRIPAARTAQPEEIAEVAVFLASDAASYLQAMTISVDGGMSNTLW
jgi:3-oxoacyl-[acyl-carrier protein] reductase